MNLTGEVELRMIAPRLKGREAFAFELNPLNSASHPITFETGHRISFDRKEICIA